MCQCDIPCRIAYACTCVRVCVRACVRACARARVCAHAEFGALAKMYPCFEIGVFRLQLYVWMPLCSRQVSAVHDNNNTALCILPFSLCLGPSVFFSCPVHQHDNPNEIARYSRISLGRTLKIQKLSHLCVRSSLEQLRLTRKVLVTLKGFVIGFGHSERVCDLFWPVYHEDFQLDLLASEYSLHVICILPGGWLTCGTTSLHRVLKW